MKEQRNWRTTQQGYKYLYRWIFFQITFGISCNIVLSPSQSLHAAIPNKRVVLVHEIIGPAERFVWIMERGFFHPHTALKWRNVDSSSLKLTAVLNKWYLGLEFKNIYISIYISWVWGWNFKVCPLNWKTPDTPAVLFSYVTPRFPVVLIVVLHKVFLTPEFVKEILNRNHLDANDRVGWIIHIWYIQVCYRYTCCTLFLGHVSYMKNLPLIMSILQREHSMKTTGKLLFYYQALLVFQYFCTK